MTMHAGQHGSASGEYLAVVAVVAVMFGSLLVFRPQTVSRHVPVDVITPVAKLLGQPLTDKRVPRRSTPPRPPGSGPPPAPRRPRPPRPEPPRIMLPEWWR